MTSTLLTTVSSVPYSSPLDNIASPIPIASANASTSNNSESSNNEFSKLAQQDAFVDYSATGQYFCQSCNEYTSLVDGLYFFANSNEVLKIL